jgi:hypothetical protein
MTARQGSVASLATENCLIFPVLGIRARQRIGQLPALLISARLHLNEGRQ